MSMKNILVPLFPCWGVFQDQESDKRVCLSSENKSFIDWSDRCWSLGTALSCLLLEKIGT